MNHKKKVMAWVFAAAAIIIAFYFDTEIVRGVSFIKSPVLSDILLGFTFASTQIIIFFVLTSFLMWTRGKGRWIFPLWLTLAASEAAAFLLKVIVERQRPFQQGLMEISPIFTITDKYYLWDFSFPSAQTAAAFCAVPILSMEFPKLKWLWIALASLVGFSRIYFGFHFLSDVIAGAVLGLLMGMAMIKTEKQTGLGERIYSRIKSKFMR